MRAWTVDADDIRVAEDFDAALLHRTPEIDEFLSHGGEKFVVVGTKGFGKTLLPAYAILQRLPRTRDGARRLGLVRREAMVAALVRAIEAPPSTGVRIVEVPEIRAAAAT